MEQYFSFNKLENYFDMLSALIIFIMVIGIIYTLVSLYYWTTKELKDRKYF